MKTVARVLKRLLVVALVAMLVAAAVTVWRGYRMYRTAIEALPLDEAVASLRADDTYVPLDELPQVYLDAVVAVEDHRFYSHIGIDPIAICRAALVDITTLSLQQGGSTITQQVAKNLFFSREKRFTRKVAEVFVAFDLERAYTKDEILELYVNSVYFGHGIVGIGAAAPEYVGCAASRMDDFDATLMAGIPNAPNRLSEDAEAALARQRIVVQQMEKYGYDPGAAAVAPVAE